MNYKTLNEQEHKAVGTAFTTYTYTHIYIIHIYVMVYVDVDLNSLGMCLVPNITTSLGGRPYGAPDCAMECETRTRNQYTDR